MTTKFTELTEIAAVDVDDADVLALSDISASASRRVTVASLRTVVGAPELSQVQVEDDASTDFGTVSGERLAQSFEVNIAASREKSATPQASTSGTAIDFTGIPAEVQEVTVGFSGVSLSGSDNVLVQIGTSSGIVTTGYLSSSTRNQTNSATTDGFIIRITDAAVLLGGTMVLTRFAPGSNIWLSSHGLNAGNRAAIGGGEVTLAAELDRVRITRDGTNTFDAGTVNVRWK